MQVHRPRRGWATTTLTGRRPPGHGVLVCNVPDYGTEEVADHAIMFLLAAGSATRLVARGDPSRGLGLPDRALGTLGSAARRSAWSAAAGSGPRPRSAPKAFGLDVVFFDPLVPQGVDKALGISRAHRLEDLLGQSDYVSLHCYLDETTHHLIDAQAPGPVALRRS